MLDSVGHRGGGFRRSGKTWQPIAVVWYSGAAADMQSARSSGHVVFVGILVVTCLAAAAFAAWSLVARQQTEVAVAGAVILLALVQLSAILFRLPGENAPSRSTRDVERDSVNRDREMRAMRRRMDALDERRDQDREDVAQHLSTQISTLERTFATLASRLERLGPLPSPARAAVQIAAARPELAQDNRAEDNRAEDDLALFLQPIVRLASGQTAYYRASYAPDGPDSETRFIARVVTVLRHLDERGRAIGVFCPLSPSAFADARFLRRLVKFMRRNKDVAGKLVIEITQADLARLSREGMQGLAWLAELGATFSLGNASPQAPDLAALKELGFQFVDLDLKTLPRLPRDRHPVLAAFATEADRHEITVMAGPVRNGEDMAGLQLAASLGHGPHFAQPRRVRADVGEAVDSSAAAA